MVHRGIYGTGRLPLDLLLCDPTPELMQLVDEDCLPDLKVMKVLEDADAFTNVMRR